MIFIPKIKPLVKIIAVLEKNHLVCKKKLRVFSQHSSLQPTLPLCITMGTFDGVHLGHQMILKNLVNYARKNGFQSGLLTFEPHPRSILGGYEQLKLLSTLDEKKEILFDLGIDFLFVKEFTKSLSELSAEEFVQHVFVDELSAKSIWIGHDHAFGKGREGNFQTLEQLGKKYGFSVHQLDVVNVDETPVSSTKIRNFLLLGKIREANKMLGRYYSIFGEVVPGRQIGSQIGFPTLNLAFSKEKLLPKFGVYAVYVFQENNRWKGVANIGTRPTTGSDATTLEIHVLDFNRMAYGEIFKIAFVDYIREEMKFPSVEKLSQQIQQDITQAKRMLG